MSQTAFELFENCFYINVSFDFKHYLHANTKIPKFSKIQAKIYLLLE